MSPNMGWRTFNRARTHLPGRWKREGQNRRALSDLLSRIWDLDINSNSLQPAGYLQHYRQVHSILDGSLTSIPDRQTVISLLDLVKLDRDLALRQIKDNLKTTGSKWIVTQNVDKAASKAVEFCIQLWLMVRLGPEIHLDDTMGLREIVARSFEISPSPSPSWFNAQQRERLSPDFGAKNLIRIGGIDIIWTSFLSEHLLLVGRDQLKVFSHVSLLRKYAQSSERCAPSFPC